jgi:hypothetical protein
MRPSSFGSHPVPGSRFSTTILNTVTTRKTAIAVPAELLREVDRAAKARGESRSKYITRVLREAVRARRDAEITRRLNELFADEDLAEEQRRSAEELGRVGIPWDDERW